jgi:hypothetical protein
MERKGIRGAGRLMAPKEYKGRSKKVLQGSATRHSSSAPLKEIEWAHRSASPFSSFDRSRALPRRGRYFFCGRRDGRTTGNLKSVGASATSFFQNSKWIFKGFKKFCKKRRRTQCCVLRTSKVLFGNNLYSRLHKNNKI